LLASLLAVSELDIQIMRGLFVNYYFSLCQLLVFTVVASVHCCCHMAIQLYPKDQVIIVAFFFTKPAGTMLCGGSGCVVVAFCYACGCYCSLIVALAC
jgi:hypothetical protein